MNTIQDLRLKEKEFSASEWVKKGLYILGIYDVTVALVDLLLDTGDTMFYGITEKLEIEDTYRIYLKPGLSDNKLKTILSHECIHIKQYHEGRLQVKDKKVLIFEGKEYFPPYDKTQPHEQEAYKGQAKLEKQIKKAFLKQ